MRLNCPFIAMGKKYELTEEILEHNGHTLHRIEALVDIADVVKAGDLGGWLESEDNLSHYGNAWVSGNAKVYDKARVSGDAEVYCSAMIYDNANVCEAACVSGEAEVYGNAKVGGDALVYGDAKIYGDAEVYGRVLICSTANVYEDATVDGDALVCGNANVCGDAWIYGKAILRDGKNETTQSYICMGPLGSRDAFTTLNLTSGTVCTGCFKGSIDEFEEAVKRTHGDNEHAKNYMKLISYFRMHITQ